jgi:hypothetical protein
MCASPSPASSKVLAIDVLIEPVHATMSRTRRASVCQHRGIQVWSAALLVHQACPSIRRKHWLVVVVVVARVQQSRVEGLASVEL